MKADSISEITETDIETIKKSAERFKPNTQLAIAKISDDQVSYYGVLVGGSNDMSPIDNSNSVFEIGSITKVFTSTLLAQLVTEGTIGLDDTIDKHLGYPFRQNAQITFKELSNHTSGLSRLPPSMLWRAIFGSSENPYKDYDEIALKLDLETRVKLKKKGKSRYSNFGAGLLAHTICEITGKSYETLLTPRHGS